MTTSVRVPKPGLKVGSWVRLINTSRPAMIVRRDDAFAPGAVLLDRSLDGFRWWNVSDLQLTRKP